MRIGSIRLRNVKRHSDLDVQLSPGLTVVRGPNEAGKSTIQQAIELGLFRRCTSSAQDMADVRRWGADDDPVVELELTDGAERGRLLKVFAGSRGTVELQWAGTTLTDPAAVDARLVELSGLASEKFFRSTASIRHQELADLDRDEGALRDRLQRSMSGADQGTWAARRKLEDALRRYRAEGARNPGALKATRDRIAALRVRAAQGETGLARLEADRQALAAARGARAALDAQSTDERRLLAASERAVTIAAKLEELSVGYKRYRRAAELRHAIDSRHVSPPPSIPLASLRTDVASIRSLEHRISGIRAELAAQPELASDLAPASPQTGPLVSLGAALIAAAIAVMALGVLLGSPQTVALGAALVLLSAGAATLLVARRRGRLASDIRRDHRLRNEEIARQLRDRSERAEELEEIVRRRDQALADLGVADPAAAEEMLAAETARVQEIERLEAEYRGLMGGGSGEEQLEAVRDALAAEADEMRHALSGMGELGAAPQRSKARYEAAVRETTARREAAIRAESDARARVEANPVDAEEVALSVEALAAATDELATIERRVRIYALTLSILDSAEQATMKKAARYLEERMGTDVARITAGRYRRIAIDENELTFRVWAPERGDWVDARQLSQGTLDQLYLAARLALVRQVTQHRHPPLIFDDPFITFDDARARQALGLLKETAADHQVIYLTTSERYDGIADRVVTLAGPTTRDPGDTTASRCPGSDEDAGRIPALAAPRVVEAVGARRSGARVVPGQMSLLASESAGDATPREGI